MRQTKLLQGLDIDSDESNLQKRGPRTELTDAQLHNRRDQLVQLFEGDWARIGLELLRCKRPEDLVCIFSPLLASYAQEVFSVFCRPSDESATGATLREIRRELRSLVEPSYSVDESKRHHSQQLQETNWALAKASKGIRRIVRRARKKQRKEAWKTEQRARTLSGKERDLKARLQKLEASFCRQEIFRFLKSKRYELNPQSLANALSNLPYSGWRQSMKRNSGVPSKVGNGMNFQIFKAIRFITSCVNKQSENALVADFRTYVPLLPSRHKLARTQLAKNWFFLERAARQGYKATMHPRVLHFAIAERYFKYVHSATQVEVVVAQQQKIELPKRSTTRTRLPDA